MHGPMGVRIRAQDPPEAWEIGFTEAEGGSYFRNERPSYPYTPRSADDVPAGALELLEKTCDVGSLSQLFIIPFAVRSIIGRLGQKVISPNSVLALGNRAVGLWTEKPRPGVKIAIALDEVAAIEDVIVLLYGRLSFVPFGDRLTIRYNTVARDEMEPELLELRKRLAGSPRVVPAEGNRAKELPFKWNGLLQRPLVRLEMKSPVAFRFMSVCGGSRRDRERGQLLALNPFELLYLCDPPETTERYGVDSFIVPRSRISRAGIEEEGLEVISNGASLVLPMAAPLREAAVRWLT